MLRTTFICGALALLTGCAAAPVKYEVQRVNIPIAVECQEAEPGRPQMPTEALQPGATVDQFVQASTAEIERREAYELELRTALTNCKRPIKQTTYGLSGQIPKEPSK